MRHGFEPPPRRRGPTDSVRTVAEIRYVTPTAEDAEPLLLHAAIAFEGYRGIAAEGWEPPDSLTPDNVERYRTAFASPDCFALAAWLGDDPIAHTIWTPAHEHNEVSKPLIPGLCHLRGLFVLEPWWGTEVATTLHTRGIDAMTASGWNEARLFTPAGQSRARRFYEREGWIHKDGPYFEPRLGLDVVEYRRPLG